MAEFDVYELREGEEWHRCGDGCDPVICGGCSGSGEGMYDGTSCNACGGSGEVCE